jgi:hypothetical protein
MLLTKPNRGCFTFRLSLTIPVCRKILAWIPDADKPFFAWIPDDDKLSSRKLFTICPQFTKTSPAWQTVWLPRRMLEAREIGSGAGIW